QEGQPFRLAFEIPRGREVAPVTVEIAGQDHDLLKLAGEKRPALEVEEISFGSAADQVSLRLAAHSRVEAVQQAGNERVQVVLIAALVKGPDGSGFLGFDLKKASSGSEGHYRELLLKEETAERAGRLEDARKVCVQIYTEFQHDAPRADRAKAKEKALLER